MNNKCPLCHKKLKEGQHIITIGEKPSFIPYSNDPGDSFNEFRIHGKCIGQYSMDDLPKVVAQIERKLFGSRDD